MRYQEMYYICKCAKDHWVEPNITENKLRDNSVLYTLQNFGAIVDVLSILAPINVLHDDVDAVYSIILGKGITPSIASKWQLYSMSGPERSQFINAVSKLKAKVTMISDILEDSCENCSAGLDIKLPDNMSLSDMSRYIRDIDLILSQCPLLWLDDTRAELSSVDRGSIWINVAVIGALVAEFLDRMIKLVDNVLIVRSHYLTNKEQEQRLKQLQFQTNMLEGVVEAFDQAHQLELQNVAGALSDEYEITAPEDRARMDEAVKRLFDLCSKGVEIYQAINEGTTTAVFPPVDRQRLTTEQIKMLTEGKQNATE